MGYYIPLCVAVLGTVSYAIFGKSIPQGANPLISLVCTYAVGIVLCLLAYYLTSPVKDFVYELKALNWATFTLGFSVVCLEMGYILMYRAGWGVSAATLVVSTTGALLLVFVGLLLFKEVITWRQVVGIVICVIGLMLVNSK